MIEKDKYVEIGYSKKGNFESHINFSGDRLIFICILISLIYLQITPFIKVHILKMIK